MIYRSRKLWSVTSLVVVLVSYAKAEVATDAVADACGPGKAIYLNKCSQCHGEAGDGKGVGADYFNPRPRDFTSGSFKLRTTESGELPTDADLVRAIRLGMPYTGMPAWPKFSDAEMSSLVCYVKTFNSDFADTSIHPKVIVIPKPPKLTPESVKHGRAIYEENKCMDCHGNFGRGDGESGPTLKDDFGNAIRPADLTKRWTFRGGPTREDIYRTFMTGLNGTPMPSFLSSIKEEDRWPLVDYLHSLSRSDVPRYGSMVSAELSKTPLDPEKLREALATAKQVVFPVVGQVIEGRRNFFPAINALEVSAIYDSMQVAILISWNDMSAQKTGTNTPVMIQADSASAPKEFSDAIALQIAAKVPEGMAKPYFLSGDKKNPAEILFVDLGVGNLQTYLGKGRTDITAMGEPLTVDASYADGKWSVVFTRLRNPTQGRPLAGGEFIPIAFSVWDGLSGESGESRGVTAWYTLYLKPATDGNPLVPAALRALIILIVLSAVVYFLRSHLLKAN